MPAIWLPSTSGAKCCYAYELAARVQSDKDQDDLLDWAQHQLDTVSDNTIASDMRHIKDVVNETVNDLEQRQIASQRGECVGITTGLSHLDRIMGGWRGGQLVVLAGRPSMGKTALSLLFARSAAEQGVPVCYFSLEMTDTMLAERILVGTSQVDVTAFRAGMVSTEDWQHIESGAELLRPLPLYLFDRSLVTMPQIRVQTRAMQRKGRCGMVIIDYLQLIGTPAEERHYGNREREVAEITCGETAGKGIGHSCYPAGAAVTQGRGAHRQNTFAFRPARVGSDRAGCRYGNLHRPSGCVWRS